MNCPFRPAGFLFLLTIAGCAQSHPRATTIVSPLPIEGTVVKTVPSEVGGQVDDGKAGSPVRGNHPDVPGAVRTVSDASDEESLSDDVHFATTFLAQADDTTIEPLEAESGVLTQEHLEQLALAHHPAIQEARSKVEALRGKWVQVGLCPNPVALYNIDEAGDAGSAGLHKFTLGQTYVTAGKLGLRRDVVAAEIEAAQADLSAARTRVQSDLRSVFQSTLVAQQRLALTKQIRDIATQSAKSVGDMQKAGEASRIEMLQSQTVEQEAVLAVETADAALAAARERLMTVVSAGELPSKDLVGEIGVELDAEVYEQIRSEVLLSSPQLAARGAEIAQAQRSLRLACASVTPDISMQLAAGLNTATDDTFGSLQVSVPLPITNRNQGNIRKSRADIVVADRALQRTELELKFRLAAAFQSYEVARLRRDRIRDEIVPRAEETLQLAVQSFEAGESSYLQLLTIQRTLFESRLSLLNANNVATQAANLIQNNLLSGIPPSSL